MSRSMVFWDTRCLLTRFACRKSVGQRTSRLSAGDASKNLPVGHRLSRPALATRQRNGRTGEFLAVYRRGQARRVDRPRILMPSNQAIRGRNVNRSASTSVCNLFEF